MNSLNTNNKKQEWVTTLVALLLFVLGSITSISAQNIAINSTGAAADNSAVVDLSQNTNGGFLLPTVTSAQLSAIPVSASVYGMLVFNSTTNCMEAYYNGSWQNIICPCSGAPSTPGTISGSASIATNSTGNTYSVAAVPGATSYSWTIQAAVGTITSTTTGSSITVTAASSAGSGTITVTAINSCGVSSAASLTVTVTTTCSGVISPDATSVESQQYDNSSSFTITTTHTNEVVLIMANGLSDVGSYSGTITVAGGSASAITVIKNTSTNDGTFAVNSELAGFIAATAATYTITVPRSNNDYDINNAAVALYGFCSTATIAANVTAVTVATVNDHNNSSLSASITPTIANSYLIGSYYNYNYDNDLGTVSWSSPSGNVILGTDDNTNDYMDGSIDGYAEGAVAAKTFTVNDNDRYGANMWIANLQLVDVHN